MGHAFISGYSTQHFQFQYMNGYRAVNLSKLTNCFMISNRICYSVSIQELRIYLIPNIIKVIYPPSPSQAQHEMELKRLKQELLEMKKQRVKMLNRMRYENDPLLDRLANLCMDSVYSVDYMLPIIDTLNCVTPHCCT